MNEKLIDAILAEYAALRTELRDKLKSQYTVISYVVTAISVILGLTSSNEELFSETTLSILHFLLLPDAVMFFGLLWLDQVYRQVTLATYISAVEQKVHQLLCTPNLQDLVGMYWEQWLISMQPRGRFTKNTNYFYSYICLGMFLLLPIVIVFLGISLVNCIFSSFPYLIIFLITFSVFIFFVIIYIKRISFFRKMCLTISRENTISSSCSTV